MDNKTKCYMVREIRGNGVQSPYFKITYDPKFETPHTLAHAIVKRMPWCGVGFYIKPTAFLKIGMFEFFDPLEVTSETYYGFSIVTVPESEMQTETFDLFIPSTSSSEHQVWSEMIEHYDLYSEKYSQTERDSIYQKVEQIVRYAKTL